MRAAKAAAVKKGRCSGCDCYWPGSGYNEGSDSESCCGRGRHRRSSFAAIEEEDTAVEEAVRECFPLCVATTESVCCRQQIGERARPTKKSKAGNEGVDKQSQNGDR
ncbi:hypothetical protein C4D60_Mb01t27460 [Musa balbisiana]|uniref:Uncharacterized protein n=1 Tax=Musa balbisiana TaxID=52838 RepID=A0A4S8JR50_MUSBA|nr:hypothetical protein C4D60_Mb01t27460 [Musa balbisiana]